MRIGVDIDGVLADFNANFIDRVVDVTGVDLFPPRPFDIPTWDYPQHYGYTEQQVSAVWEAIKADRAFWRMLNGYPTTYSDLLYLITLDLHGSDIYFITSRPGIEAKYQTEGWFKRMGPISNFHPTVIISSEKGMVAQALKLDVYVDDRWENCVDVCWKSRAITFLVDRPWNRVQAALNLRTEEHEIYVTDRVEGIVERADELRAIRSAMKADRAA